MKKSITTLTTLAILSASQGQAMHVTRCNAMLETGTYAPVLEVRSAKSNEILFIGRDGLTRNIYYKDRLALEYVSAKLGVPKPHTLKEIGHCASQPGEDREPDAAPAIDPDPVTPTTETPTVDETPEVETPTTEEVDVVAVVF